MSVIAGSAHHGMTFIAETAMRSREGRETLLILRLHLGIRLADASAMDRSFMDELEERTKQFAISVIRLCIKLETCEGLRRVADQLVDSAGSVAANHRAMRRARSPREFASKTHIVLEEADEGVLWLEIAVVFPPRLDNIQEVLAEGRQLRAIFARAYATARRKVPDHTRPRR